VCRRSSFEAVKLDDVSKSIYEWYKSIRRDLGIWRSDLRGFESFLDLDQIQVQLKATESKSLVQGGDPVMLLAA
jgi:hypothetical protein